MQQVEDYPGLRRRFPDNNDNNDNNSDTTANLNDLNNTPTAQQQQQLQPQQPQQQQPQQQQFYQPIRRNRSRVRLNNNNQVSPATTSTRTSIRNVRTRSSHVYILFSSFVAFLAIISPPTKRNLYHDEYKYGKGGVIDRNGKNSNDSTINSHGSNLGGKSNHHNGQVVSSNSLSDDIKELLEDNIHQYHSAEQVATTVGASGAMSDLGGNKDKPRLLKYATSAAGSNVGGNNGVGGMSSDIHHGHEVVKEETNPMVNLFGKKNEKKRKDVKESKQNNNKSDDLPQWLKWLMPWHNNKNNNKKGHNASVVENQKAPTQNAFMRVLHRLIDPSLLSWMKDLITFDQNKDSTKTATYIFDKIIHSTPRLIAIANLLLAGTYILHTSVADYFLGDTHAVAGNAATAEFGNGNPAMVGISGVGASTSNRIHRSGRERLGGYLLFKLLLISAVVEPDTLDLLILLSWYTLLSFLKSLSFLAGVTTAHAAASGQMPHNGVMKLLILVLFCDLTAAATCAALFHAAGWGMVILLTCDCALLALDVLTHLIRYFQQILDERHQTKIAELEATQIRMFEINRNNETVMNSNQDLHAMEREEDYGDEIDSNNEVHILSRQLDHEMEILETRNSKYLAILDNIAFLFEMCALIITTCHFMHIWTLHGIAFNLVDGVLALHLHSAISAIGKKISERRNHNRIARDLDNYFEDVTDIELKKACATGDVCCICLGTMSMGNVKKIGCGHIYHTNCLREVVERARSIEGARCPLCRQSIVDGSHIPSSQSSGMPQPFMFGGLAGNNPEMATTLVQPRDSPTVQQDNANQNRNNRGQIGENQSPGNVQQNQNERALFRFSTEGILPVWLPLPAFSFEVVRRPPLGTELAGDNVVPPQIQQQQNLGNNDINGPLQNQQDGQPPSFWRRLLILVGAIPMSPEEEAAAVAQLVDMFPQYERADLLRELRERGSAEAVVESIFAGRFSGVDRGNVAVVDNAIVNANEIERGEEVSEDVNDGERAQDND